MDTNLSQKLKDLGKVSSLRKFQLFEVSYKEIAAMKKMRNCCVAKTLMSSYILFKVWDLSERICRKEVRRLLILTYLQTLQNNGYCFYKNVNHKNMHYSTHTGVCCLSQPVHKLDFNRFIGNGKQFLVHL